MDMKKKQRTHGTAAVERGQNTPKRKTFEEGDE